MKKSTTTNKTSTAKGKTKAITPSRQAKGDHQQRQPAKSGADQRSERGEPMRDSEEVQENNDEHIDQDFPGYPHHPSHGRSIHNGSAGAFDATEHSHDEEDEDQDNDDFAMDR